MSPAPWEGWKDASECQAILAENVNHADSAVS